MSQKNYNINDVSQNLAGIMIDSGFGEDTVVKVTKDSDDFGDKVGADGEVTRYNMNDERVTIEFTLMQSSDVNAQLSALNILDKNAPGGAGVGPYFLKDNNGTTLLLCTQAWIAKPPDMEFGKEVKERVWKIRGIVGVRLDGGN